MFVRSQRVPRGRMETAPRAESSGAQPGVFPLTSWRRSRAARRSRNS